MEERAGAVYRELNNIPETLGTAVTVQAMVFGNRGRTAGLELGLLGILRRAREKYSGNFLPNAQGEDIVAGTRTPVPLTELAEKMPGVYRELVDVTARLENHYRDVQDFEFTVESGKLFCCRHARRRGRRLLR